MNGFSPVVAWVVLYVGTRATASVIGLEAGTGTLLASTVSFLGSVSVALIEVHYSRREQGEKGETLRKENRRLKRELRERE